MGKQTPAALMWAYTTQELYSLAVTKLHLSTRIFIHTLFSHQCNPSLKIKKFHSSTSRRVSAAKDHHQVSCHAKTVAVYKIKKKICKIFIYSHSV
jgi:hypothetical protein